MTAKNLNCQQAWWSVELADYNFILVHKPGKSHQKPDLQKGHDRGEHNNEGVTLLKAEFLWAMETQPAAGRAEDTPGDLFLKQIQMAKNWSELAEELGFKLQDDYITKDGLVYIPNDANLRNEIMWFHHDTIFAGIQAKRKHVNLCCDLTVVAINSYRRVSNVPEDEDYAWETPRFT